MSKLHAEIAGGGIAALTAATRLAQLGWSVRLHERAPVIRDAGAGIYVWENGLRVLETIGAHDRAVDGAVTGAPSEFRDRGGPPVKRVPPNVRQAMRLVSIPRDKLLGAILEQAQAAGVDIVTSSEAAAARPNGVLVLADGREFPADLVIGADGVRSRVRDSLGLLRSYDEAQDGAIRTMVPRLPEDGGDTYVEHWNGTRRILVTPVSADQIYLALTALDSDRAAKTLPLQKDVWRESFPHLGSLIDRIGDTARWDLFVTVKLSRWSEGRVAVLGDAAHAMAPNLGQGGGLAMQNGLSLAAQMGAISDPTEIPAALQAWEARERPLAEHTQTWSWLYGFLTTWPDSLRKQAFEVAAKEAWIVEQRFRTALSEPYGAVPKKETAE